MTFLDNGTCYSDLDDEIGNSFLVAFGWTIRHIEDWHRNGTTHSIIAWDAPQD